MRELDLLLENFLLPGLTSLSNDDLDGLEHLLEQPDQDILAWLTSAAKPGDAEFRRIVTILRGRIYSQPNADA
jgi:antitoxin CptB